jgi:hypothetical protein
LTDRPEERRPEHEPGRPLSSEEQKFYGEDRDDREVDRDREVRERVRREEEGSYEAGAGAPAPPLDERAVPDHRERERADDHAALRHREDEPSGSQERQTMPREATPLFTSDDAESLRSRWDGIQARFVDEPRDAVEKADALVGDVMQRLTDGFSAERSRLEREWDRGDRVSTEDLRVALKRYRSFFDRLLSV